MNWEAIGAGAELLGSIAVIATLIYLARQIAVQNRSADIEVQDSVLGGFNDVVNQLAFQPNMANLFEKGLLNPDDLTRSESSQFAWMLRSVVNQYLKLWQLHKQGAINDSDFERLFMQGAWIMQSEGGRRWLQNEFSNYPEFEADLMAADLPKGAVFALNVFEKPGDDAHS